MRDLNYVSQELIKILKLTQPQIKNGYNQVTLSTQKQTIVIPKQSNSKRSSSSSRSV
jgi:hypothetical protein